MQRSDTEQLLRQVAAGETGVEEALLQLKEAPIIDLGYAQLDQHRALRQGFAEVIYGAGKTAEQIAGIAETFLAKGQKTVLITRMDAEKAALVSRRVPLSYHEDARVGIAGVMPPDSGSGTIVVATGGTSDIPVAEEAALTAEALGNRVTRLYDVGVAGLHRLLGHMDEIMSARVIIAIAGMEGALASVIGGLADCPVIAVPTSVGYGASFGGVSALLSMLNSCASGVSVVNIDNGFGAGYLAAMINHIGNPSRENDQKPAAPAAAASHAPVSVVTEKPEERAETPQRNDTEDLVIELQCNLDDMTAEDIGFASEQLLAAGALDVFTTPIQMKKNRPATLLSCLCRPEDRERLAELIFRHTSTLGIRGTEHRRFTLQRRETCLQTDLGEVRVKTSEGYGVCRSKPEYDDIRRIALREGLSLAETRARLQGLLDALPDEE